VLASAVTIISSADVDFRIPRLHQSGTRLLVQIARLLAPDRVCCCGLWGRPVSTWVVNPGVRTEAQCPRKSRCKSIVANDDNLALAA
jgi:hypothetical protein